MHKYRYLQNLAKTLAFIRFVTSKNKIKIKDSSLIFQNKTRTTILWCWWWSTPWYWHLWRSFSKFL